MIIHTIYINQTQLEKQIGDEARYISNKILQTSAIRAGMYESDSL